MTNPLSRLFSTCVVLAAFPLASFAMPSVSGNTVTWPSDGWYQVQRADNFETVCEGIESSDSSVSGGLCIIDSGSYIVINHTSGERFENISATTASTSPDGVLVEGDRISWPDNGWYQVQDASTFLTICEGGTGCTVAPGNYIVINHTTGERFSDVGVGAGSPSDSGGRPVSVVVQGDRIRWPDNGWYQVQNASNFESLCEGGSECQVTPGTYIVINHTSGERTLLEVSGDSTTPGGLDAIASTRVTFNINVPAYVSNALQVRVMWGDREGAAAWVTNESWTAIDDLPTNTENLLTVTFSDQNGVITLGSFEQAFRTGTNAFETVQINADQFDTGRWDNDGDGVSNIEELIAGTDPALANTNTETNPGPSETLLPVSASIELIPDKTFRIRWQPTSAADFYRVLENPDGVSGFTAVSGELDASTDFYDHRVGLHQRVNARYMVEACNSTGCTLSAQQLIEGNLVEAIGYLKASTLGINEVFGSVVSISGDGNTLAVSAPSEDSAATGVNGDQGDDSTVNSGAVYVFTRSDRGWQQQAYLKASNPDRRDRFGSELSLSADGNTLAVGVAFEDSNARGVNGDQTDNSAFSAGAVYVFLRNGDSWQQQAYLKASNTEANDEFGQNVSLSAAGNTLAVGAKQESSDALGINGDQDNNNEPGSGAVYVFVRSGGTWQQQAYIKASTSDGLIFGRSVSLSTDGNIMAVGAHNTTGDVHMFERSGGIWREEAVFGDLPGSPIVSLSGDGHTVAVVALTSTVIFENTGGSWQEQARFTKGRTSTLNQYTDGISLSADGNTLAIGSSRDFTGQTGLQGYRGVQPRFENAGAVFVYTRGDGTWLQEVYVKASNTSISNQFGKSVSLSANGDTLAVGAFLEGGESTGFNGDQTQPPDLGEFYGSGAVYLY